MGAENSKSNINTEKDDISAVKTEDNCKEYLHPSLSEIARMDRMIRRKLQGGLHYNMKIIVSGMRGTGKSSLWRRFQGLTFTNKVRFDNTNFYVNVTMHFNCYFELQYSPTPEIQVRYKLTRR